jgi:spore germination protein KB
MIEKGKISNSQAMMLLINGVLATGLLTFPSLTTAQAKQDAWLSVIIAACVGLVVILITVPLGWRFPGKTIVEYSENILGKFLGKAVGIIFVWFFLYLSAIVVREFGEFIVSVFMEETPLIVFVVSILLVAVLPIYGGLEVIGRINTLMFALVVVSFFTFMFLAVGQMEPSELTPVLAEGLGPVLKGAIPAAGWLSEVVAIGFLLPYINRPALARRSGSTAMLILLVLHGVAVAASVMIFGAAQTGRMQFPAFMIARNVSVLGIFERTEAFFMLLWVAGVFAKIAIYYYVTVLGASQLFKLRDYRPLILPIGTVIGAMAILDYLNNAEVVSFLGKVWGPYSLPIELGLPAILLIVAIIRCKRRRNR